MLSKLLPYRIFDKFDDISPEYLTSLGVRFLFSDVDNTLAPYEVPEPDERIRAWLDSLTEAGIKDIDASLKRVLENGKSFFVSPKESDVITQEVAKLLASSISLAFTGGY